MEQVNHLCKKNYENYQVGHPWAAFKFGESEATSTGVETSCTGLGNGERWSISESVKQISLLHYLQFKMTWGFMFPLLKGKWTGLHIFVQNMFLVSEFLSRIVQSDLNPIPDR